MAWAIFHETFNHDRRPKQAIAFEVKPGTKNMPRDVVDAAIAAGKATAVKPPGKPSETTTRTDTAA